MKKIFLFISLSFLLSAAASAQEVKAQLKGSVPAVTLAKPFELTFSIPVPEAGSVKLDEENTPADFEILSHSSVQDALNVDFTLTAMAFTLDKSTFTALSWQIFDRSGSPAGTALSADLVIDVKKAKTIYPNSDIVDIRGPYFPIDWWMWLRILGIILLITAAVIWYKSRKVSGDVPVLREKKAKETLPPHLAAKREIDELMSSMYWIAGEYKQFYISLTDIFRRYMDLRYGWDSETQTTNEFLKTVRNSHARAQLGLIKAFLSHSDMVKFARQVPLAKDRDEDIALLIKIIDDTTPVLNAADKEEK
ncbi:hypothetical protein Dip518_000708 [Parelusimicrobium proximum]|uniref:hypothetical protein n=1 Tax=Parelusimicrobium proximum TaxID=3228953 RepID=UPI003D17D009